MPRKVLPKMKSATTSSMRPLNLSLKITTYLLCLKYGCHLCFKNYLKIGSKMLHKKGKFDTTTWNFWGTLGIIVHREIELCINIYACIHVSAIAFWRSLRSHIDQWVKPPLYLFWIFDILHLNLIFFLV